MTQEKYGRYFPGRYLPYVKPGATPFELMEEERERETRNEDLEAQVRGLKTTLEEKSEPAKKKLLEKRLAEVPANLREDLRILFATPPEKRTETQKFLAGRFEKVIRIKLDEAIDGDPAFRREAEEIQKKIKLLQAKALPPPRIRALWDRGEPSQAYLLRRGSASSFGPPVEPGVPSALTDGKTPFEIKPPWPGANKTGRRLAFARWLVRPEPP